MPGLANLVGYMIMKGSGGYPKLDNFKKFLEKYNSSMIPPITNEDEQIFSFEINPDYFAEALKR